MSNNLNTQTLKSMGAEFAVLSVADYALPVRYRVNGWLVECRVPIWICTCDLLEEGGEVTLVAVQNLGNDLCWIFLRGIGSVINNPDWEGLEPEQPIGLETGDLYQLLRIKPNRIEYFDERRGWGFRETADF